METKGVSYTVLEAWVAMLKEDMPNSAVPYTYGVVNANRDRGFELHIPPGRAGVSTMIKSAQRNAPETEQAKPLSVDGIKEGFKKAHSERDLNVMLVLTAAWFTCSRVDAVLSMVEDELVFHSKKGLEVVHIRFHKKKGQVHAVDRKIDMEAVNAGPPLCVKKKLWGEGDAKLCPVVIFKKLQERYAIQEVAPYQKLQRSIKQLMPELSSHSSRVGGVCTLLRSGLDPVAVEALADWDSEMIQHYSKSMILQPYLVQVMKFYNPTGLGHLYAF